MKRRHILALSACLSLAAPFAHAADAWDPALREKARRAVDAGLNYLRTQQAADGSVARSVGITALSLRAFLESHRGYNEGDGAFITRQVDFLLSKVKPDGSINESLQNASYNTAVALAGLAATKNPKYDAVISAAQKFLIGHQIEEGEGYKQDHRYYGGIGYGGDERPDMSNVYLALEGLKATAADPKDPVWQKALVFVNRSQNRSESNDQKWAANDGGFVYMPGWNPPEFEFKNATSSYGGMTAAGLLSLLYAGVDKNDPRVQAAYKWMTANYSLEVNPGTTKRHGIFYFYNAFAKVMKAYGEDTFTDAKGVKHNWKFELAQKLTSLQNPDGTWSNPDSKAWWEDKPQLVTAWSVIALEHALK
ncbi:MAG: terpene cyclase/mutase family protein [Rubrivivax sp.]|nr:terpene cyclase/mutase family protein [Rubrivivax sp.]